MMTFHWTKSFLSNLYWLFTADNIFVICCFSRRHECCWYFFPYTLYLNIFCFLFFLSCFLPFLDITIVSVLTCYYLLFFTPVFPTSRSVTSSLGVCPAGHSFLWTVILLNAKPTLSKAFRILWEILLCCRPNNNSYKGQFLTETCKNYINFHLNFTWEKPQRGWETDEHLHLAKQITWGWKGSLGHQVQRSASLGIASDNSLFINVANTKLELLFLCPQCFRQRLFQSLIYFNAYRLCSNLQSAFFQWQFISICSSAYANHCLKERTFSFLKFVWIFYLYRNEKNDSEWVCKTSHPNRNGDFLE